jgi:hypothetical protein
MRRLKCGQKLFSAKVRANICDELTGVKVQIDLPEARLGRHVGAALCVGESSGVVRIGLPKRICKRSRCRSKEITSIHEAFSPAGGRTAITM